MSFLRCEASQRLGKENKLVKLSTMINWNKLGKNLQKIYAYEINNMGGNKPYDSLKMYKAILLGQWYNLSDPELEEALKVRLDFMMFTQLEGSVPDETTLCRFRNKLSELGLEEILLQEVNNELESLGLKVKKCEGAVIDATIIESSSRPRKTIEVIEEDRKEKDLNESSSESIENSISYGKDPDARWLKKGKRYYYGYKGFVATDAKDGYIEKIKVTPANRSEVKELVPTLPDKKPVRVYADKGYASKDNRNQLQKRQIKDGIMEKAVRGKPLSYWQKKKNKLISSKRFIVEQAFGTLKRRFQFSKASYVTRVKVQTQFILKATCFNLLKALNKVKLIPVS